MFIRVTGAWLVMFCALSSVTFGQEKKRPKDLEMFGVSPKLQARLTKRLLEFVECQGSLDCPELGRFVAGYYFQDPERKKRAYTQLEKQKLIEGIKQRPILAFIVRQAIGSTINFNVPLSKRVWWLEGCAEFRKEEKIQKAEARVFVYYQRDWLFSPIMVEQYAGGNLVPCKNDTTIDNRISPPNKALQLTAR